MISVRESQIVRRLREMAKKLIKIRKMDEEHEIEENRRLIWGFRLSPKNFSFTL